MIGVSSADRTPVGGVRIPVAARPPAARRRVWLARPAGRGRLFALVVLYFLFSFWQVWSTGRSDQARTGRCDRRDGRRPVRRPAVATVGSPARPRGRAVVAGSCRPDRRHRRQPAGRPIHRGRGVRRLSGRTRASPSRRSVSEGAGTSTYESLAGVAELLSGGGSRHAC